MADMARLVKNFVAPLTSISLPSTMNARTSRATTVRTWPGTPFVSAYRYMIKRDIWSCSA